MEQKLKAQVLALEARHKEHQEELEAKLKNQEAMLEESLQRERRFLEILNTQPRSGSTSRGGTPPVSVSSPNAGADNTRTVSHPGTHAGLGSWPVEACCTSNRPPRPRSGRTASTCAAQCPTSRRCATFAANNSNSGLPASCYAMCGLRGN